MVPRLTIEEFVGAGHGSLVGHLGITFDDLTADPLTGAMKVGPHVMAPHGFLHGGAVVAFADTVCGYACWRDLPDDARSFATVNLSANFTGTARAGTVLSTATLVHRGRSTEVWDATVENEDGRTIAVVRCTQMILRD